MSDFSLPYEKQLNGFTQPIKIIARPNDNASRFEVNLLDNNGEYLLHYNVRFDEKRVIRNSTTAGQQWQREERDGGMPFHIGKEFILDLVPNDGSSMQCIVDGVEQCFFRVRHGDLNEAAKLSISGDIQLSNVELHGGTQENPQAGDPSTGGDWGNDNNPQEPTPNEPQPLIGQPDEPNRHSAGNWPDIPPPTHPSDPGQLSVPYNSPLQEFTRTRRLRIIGTPTEGAKQFEVIMRLSNGDAVLHFLARLDQNFVSRNATHNMQWQPQWEDKSGSGCPFHPGKQFSLDIISDGQILTCYVDGPLFCAYRIHGDINQIHSLQINGDIQLQQVVIA
uniref:Galectin n=1 Tax=Panagrolaimus sp. PS1159 TaxID=55785 RepID=A0AC35GRC0_9BILA